MDEVPAVGAGVEGDVRQAATRPEALLVRGRAVDRAEPSAAAAGVVVVGRAAVVERLRPCRLADVVAGRVVRVERGAADARDERIGSRRADGEDRGCPVAVELRGAAVSRRGDERDPLRDGLLEERMLLREETRARALLGLAEALRDDVAGMVVDGPLRRRKHVDVAVRFRLDEEDVRAGRHRVRPENVEGRLEDPAVHVLVVRIERGNALGRDDLEVRVRQLERLVLDLQVVLEVRIVERVDDDDRPLLPVHTRGEEAGVAIRLLDLLRRVAAKPRAERLALAVEQARLRGMKPLRSRDPRRHDHSGCRDVDVGLGPRGGGRGRPRRSHGRADQSRDAKATPGRSALTHGLIVCDNTRSRKSLERGTKGRRPLAGPSLLIHCCCERAIAQGLTCQRRVPQLSIRSAPSGPDGTYSSAAQTLPVAGSIAMLE